MNANHAFQQIWSKYLPIINLKLRQAIAKNEAQTLQMDKYDFTKIAATKGSTAFTFTLDFRNGMATNNMKLPLVAREFVAALNENKTSKEMIQSGYITFKMSAAFILSIKTHEQPVPVN